MKKLPFILLILIFASSASATVYKWVDQRGVVNFADDYSKVPPGYRNKAEELNINKMGTPTPSQALSEKITVGAQSGKTATQPPPIAQTLVREGDFAIKLVEAFKIGQAKSEAEAENMLASAGIIPKNGWIADYPMTPDIIAELENAVAEAADANRLPIAKNEALKALRTTAVELELPIIAEIPEGYTESPPPETPQYTEPSVIDNYYYAEGPPVITYYPPPWDYYYMYAWIPSPFWCSGYFFSGFFVLHDFHRVIHGYRHAYIVTNHIRDPRTGRIFAMDPARRSSGRIFGGMGTPPVRGLNSTEAKNGAQSIFQRSRDRVALGNTSTSTTTRGLRNRTPSDLRSGRSTERQVYNRENRLSGFNGRNGDYGRPPVMDRRMSRTPSETGFQGRGMSNRTFSRSDSMNRQSGMNFQRPSSSETRSFSPLSRGGERSFSSHPQDGGQHYSSPPVGSRGFSGSPQGGNSGSSFGHGGPRF
jgi:hypothetical protein